VAELEDVLAPLYFHHRYQLDATVKSIGGFRYRHALRGDGADVAGSVPAATQRAALEAVLEVLSPAALDLPEEVLAWLVPRPPGAGRNRELFNGRSAPVFDPIAAAETMAEHVLASLLNRERCERLVDFQRRDPGQLGLEELLARIGETVFPARLSRNARHAELQRVVQDVCVRAGIRLAEDRHASERVRSRVESVLHELASGLAESEAVDPVQRAHTTVLLRRIERFLARESEPAAAPSTAPEPPPGSPIGAEARFQACSSPPAWL